MKKLFLSVILVAFAVSVNAGEGKECKGCPSKAKLEAKAQCPASAKQAKETKQTATKVKSPKASEQAKN